MTKVRSIQVILTLTMLILALICLSGLAAGQGHSKKAPQSSGEQRAFGDEISGMYSFLREGEFVQITVEEGKLSGFVSRYGDRDSDRDAFLDQFFKTASLEGRKISFTTKAVHGTWFEFSGTVSRGDAKTPDQDGYWIIKGTLKKYSEDEDKKVSAESRQVTFKSFPQDTEADQQPK